MSAEAIARLREELARPESMKGWCEDIRADDLRALLDAHAEALDALERFVPLTKGMGFGGMDSTFDRENARTVLAKAGRR